VDLTLLVSLLTGLSISLADGADYEGFEITEGEARQFLVATGNVAANYTTAQGQAAADWTAWSVIVMAIAGGRLVGYANHTRGRRAARRGGGGQVRPFPRPVGAERPGRPAETVITPDFDPSGGDLAS
jgi:hypothetical protein